MEVYHGEEIAFFSKKNCKAGNELNRVYTRYKPVSIPRKAGDTVSFAIDKDKKNFTDLKNSYIGFKIQIIKKADDEPYVKSETEQVACIDNMRFSFIKSASLKLNNTLVGNPNAQTWLHKFFDMYIEPTDYRIRTTEKIFAGAADEDDAGIAHFIISRSFNSLFNCRPPSLVQVARAIIELILIYAQILHQIIEFKFAHF